jgi:hypothetical protein
MTRYQAEMPKYHFIGDPETGHFNTVSLHKLRTGKIDISHSFYFLFCNMRRSCKL